MGKRFGYKKKLEFIRRKQMEYRDNMAYFKFECGCVIENGLYTVEECSITSGQDPDGYIKPSLLVAINSDASNLLGKIHFNIGRHGSEEVANWFIGKVAPDQTTFNDTPDLLNFAFVGELVLNLRGDFFGASTPVKCTFERVVIAQGHSGATNNWWFGGSNCKNTGVNKVECHGSYINDKKELKQITIEVFRGGSSNPDGNPVNEFKITSIDPK